MKCIRYDKLNNLRKYIFGNINILISVILSAVFLGFSKSEEDITKALFFTPIIVYIYSCVIIKKPFLLLVYLFTFSVTKKINDNSR